MNTDTGQLYTTPETIKAAQDRGETLAFVSERVVKLIRAGLRAEHKAKAKRKRKQVKESRRRNR